MLLFFLTGYGQRALQKPYSKYAKGFRGYPTGLWGHVLEKRLETTDLAQSKYSLTELLAYL